MSQPKPIQYPPHERGHPPNHVLKAVFGGMVILLLSIASQNGFIFPLFILKFRLCKDAMLFHLEIFTHEVGVV